MASQVKGTACANVLRQGAWGLQTLRAWVKYNVTLCQAVPGTGPHCLPTLGGHPPACTTADSVLVFFLPEVCKLLPCNKVILSTSTK
jgi:hypothetical protein